MKPAQMDKIDYYPWSDPSSFVHQNNAVANEVKALREQQEYQFYVHQGMQTRLNEESERPRTNRIYFIPSKIPSPERSAAVCDLMNTINTNQKDDSFSLSEVSALLLFTGLIASIVGGLIFLFVK